MLFGINAIMVVGFQVFVGNTGTRFLRARRLHGDRCVRRGDRVHSRRSTRTICCPICPASWRSSSSGSFRRCSSAERRRPLFALVTGVALMRLSGAAASIATLGLLVITVNVLSQATAITHGPRSLFGVPAYADFSWVFGALAVVVLISAVVQVVAGWSARARQSRRPDRRRGRRRRFAPRPTRPRSSSRRSSRGSGAASTGCCSPRSRPLRSPSRSPWSC